MPTVKSGWKEEFKFYPEEFFWGFLFMDKESDIKYMRIALNLAKKGVDKTSPNPAVGSILVKNNKILGKGFHKFAGGNHAEVNAIQQAGDETYGATMYVTLEPCCHYGKTPPCVSAIKKAGIKKVVIGMKDPNPRVCGNGIKELRKEKIKVELGILENDAKKLNEVYIKYITTKMPFVILKYAMTFDGKIASITGDSKWISGISSREFVQKLRSKVDAILVGVNTVIKDNPRLTVRGIAHKNPVRIVLDSFCRIPLLSNVLDNSVKTIIATTHFAPKNRIERIKETGAHVLVVKSKNKKIDIKILFKELGKIGITNVFIEGGSEVNSDALLSGIVDKIYVFISPLILGGKKAITSVGGDGIKFVKDAIKIENLKIKKIGTDFLLEGYVHRNN